VDVDVDVVERGDETRDANEAGERRGILRSTTKTTIGRSVGRAARRETGRRSRETFPRLPFIRRNVVVI
jgi:hypothetical protein